MNKIVIYIILFLFAFASCNKDKEGDVPCTLSHKSVNIKVDEKVTVKVVGSKSFSVTIDNSIASATIVNNDIIVEGVAEGKTTLTVIIGNRQLNCSVTITAKATEGGDGGEEDYTKELENKTLRVIGSGIDMNYENMGSLFSKSNANGVTTYTAVELDKNEYISFSVLGELPQNGAVTVSTIRSTTLNISKIESATILQQETGVVWLKIEHDSSKSLLWVFEK